MTRTSPVVTVILLLASLLLAIFCLLPLVWMISTSLKETKEIFSLVPQWIPTHVTLQHYIQLIGTTPFVTYFINSFMVSAGSSILAVLASFLAAYSFSRFEYKGKRFLMSSVIYFQIFPWIILVIPLYILFHSIGLMNSLWGLVVAYTTFNLPFSIYMMRSYFNTIPKELDEAAQIDGCGLFGILFGVLLPITLPGVVATFIYAFIGSWNEYLFAMLFMTSEANRTLPLGLSLFFGEFTAQWGLVMAAATATSLPVILLFLFLQKYLVSGLTGGSVKG